MNCKNLLLVFCFFLPGLYLPAQTGTKSSTVYIHPEPPAFSVRLIKVAARIFLSKNSIERKLSEKNFVSKAARIPQPLFSEFIIDTSQIGSRDVYTISPKAEPSGKYVLFLHGGAYINNIFRQHWIFAAHIIRRTRCTFVIPDYPLAPASCFTDAFTMLYAIYGQLITKVSPSRIILMGDSAGGGLALALAEKQHKDGIPQAGQIILLCPWLDVSMTNPGIRDIQKKDVVLDAEALALAGKAWSGPSCTDQYLICPINGSFHGLPRISLFIGTHDILFADCRKLKIMLDQEGIAMNYYEYPKMFHDWMMLTSLPEAQKTISQITSLILN